jgi:hypothetical protein
LTNTYIPWFKIFFLSSYLNSRAEPLQKIWTLGEIRLKGSGSILYLYGSILLQVLKFKTLVVLAYAQKCEYNQYIYDVL